MRSSLSFSVSLIVAASLHSAIAQSSPTPAPTPVTLRSLLLSELHSTHDKAEWFIPIQAAVAGLTAEQAKWVPQNAQGKIDPSANHSVGMLAYHLVFWNENALARLRGEKPASPGNNQETFNDFDAAHWNEIVQRLDRVMKDLEAAVEKMPEEKLALKAPLISHISTHNAYHRGRFFMSASYKVPGIRRTASNEIPLNHPGISCVLSRRVCLTQLCAGISMGIARGGDG